MTVTFLPKESLNMRGLNLKSEPVVSFGCTEASGTDTPDVLHVFHAKYGPSERLGWGPQLRLRFGYFNPDDIYEATVASLIDPSTDWLDVGCGSQVFPDNLPTAQQLSQRCQSLVGVDPSENINDNELIHDGFRGVIEDFHTERRFDLVTLRMVAEHITSPAAAVAAFSRLLKPNGRVVIYTVFRWSPVTLLSGSTPMWVHHLLKRVIWRTEEKDTFPVTYLMNTRARLKAIFHPAGFQEERFCYLDDCRTLARWRPTVLLELCIWRALRFFRLHYPEVCILGVYRKGPE